MKTAAIILSLAGIALIVFGLFNFFLENRRKKVEPVRDPAKDAIYSPKEFRR